MRTTIQIQDDLLRAAKQLAAASDRTLGQVVEDALRETLARPKQPAQLPPVRLPTDRGRGLAPGVNLDCSAELLDHLDAAD